MHQIKNKHIPHVFLELFGVPCHAYPTNFSLINLSVRQKFLKAAQFSISATGLIHSNNCVSKNKREINDLFLFKQQEKKKM